MTNEVNKHIEKRYNELKKKYITEYNCNTINHNGVSIEDVFQDIWLNIIIELADCTSINEVDRVIASKQKGIKLTNHKRPLQLFEQTEYFVEDEEPEPPVDIATYLLSNYADRQNNIKIR